MKVPFTRLKKREDWIDSKIEYKWETHKLR